jgi:hypothetical protein
MEEVKEGEIQEGEVQLKDVPPKVPVNPLHETFMKRTVKERDSRKRLSEETLDEYHYRLKVMKKLSQFHLMGKYYKKNEVKPMKEKK